MIKGFIPFKGAKVKLNCPYSQYHNTIGIVDEQYYDPNINIYGSHCYYFIKNIKFTFFRYELIKYDN
jgi:hypothetical protein